MYDEDFDDLDEGFPWNRVKAAQNYLYAIKPWWYRFGSRLKVVPISVPPPSGKQYGALTSTDTDMNLYIDRLFAISAPISRIAGAIEHELQHHVRDSWGRLLWLSEDEREQYLNIALDLEINSAIRMESNQIPFEKALLICERSELFTVKDIHKWGVDELPNILDDCWLPEKLGFPDGLSAESYYRLIKKNEPVEQDQPPEDDDQVNDPSPETQGDDDSSPESDPESGDSDEQDQSQSPEQDQSDEQSDDTSPENQDSSDDDQESDDGEGSAGSGDPEQQVQDSPGSGDGQPGQGESDGDGQPSPGSGDAESETGTGSGSGSSEQSPSNSSSDGSSTSGSGNQSPTVKELISQIKKNEPSLAWFSKELPQGDDQPSWKTDSMDDDTPDQSKSMRDGLKELVIDIERDSSRRGQAKWGMAPGNALLKWSQGEMVKLKVNWQTQLGKVLSSSLDSAMIQGASDLSYAVRNPNQPKYGPVLMGLHDYSPKIMVVQDVSGSMASFLDTSLSAFKGIVTASMNRFGDGMTWMTVDTEVQDVGKSVSFGKEIEKRWSKGYGGTVFKKVLTQVANGQFKWGNKRYPRPDVILLSTDCFFEWPWRDTRPPGKPKIIVCSVLPYSRVERVLPRWVVEGKNFIYLE